MTIMTSIGSFLRLRRKESSELEREEVALRKGNRKVAGSDRNLLFDLFAQLAYLSTIATSGITRTELFEHASRMPYTSSKYFSNVHFLAQRLNIDYAEACRMVAMRTDIGEVRGFLLRLSGAMSAGEDEADFLLRESEAMAAAFANRYERDVESLKKWTDAYVTLVVAAALIVIVSVISMMIYDIGTPITVGMALTMVFVTILGGWIIYVSAPHEVKTRARGPTSAKQILAHRLFKILAPIGVTISALALYVGFELGWTFLILAIFLFVPGFIITRDDKRIGKLDADIPTVVRVLGGVTSAIGTTVTQALGQIDRRSMGSLTPEIDRLHLRLLAGIEPEMCWDRFVDETGSELVDRTKNMFWDALNLGADAGRAGTASALFSSNIAFLRANRDMVATTFRYLIMPLHGAMIALLLFIPEIMKLFSLNIQASADFLTDGGSSNLPNSSMAIGELFTFGDINLGLVNFLVTFVVIVLTGADAFAPKAAEGGSNLKLIYNLAIMLTITGVMMIAVPMFANSIFESIVTS